jgi:hypothetical protein
MLSLPTRRATHPNPRSLRSRPRSRLPRQLRLLLRLVPLRLLPRHPRQSLPLQSRHVLQHPSPKPRSPASACLVRVIPASMAIVPTATLRVRRANAVRAASRLRFRDLAHSATITMPMLRRAAMATMPPMVRSRTLRAHVRVTIRSAASRACIPRLRVTFRVRIR